MDVTSVRPGASLERKGGRRSGCHTCSHHSTETDCAAGGLDPTEESLWGKTLGPRPWSSWDSLKGSAVESPNRGRDGGGFSPVFNVANLLL